MSLAKCASKAPADVFHAFLVEKADYDGIEEIPCIKTSRLLPARVIPFSKALQSTDFDQWVVFYEHDSQFVRLWNNPRKYINILRKYKGVVTPDFSLYRNMPLVMQKWSTYQGKAIGVWLQNKGVEVIPNVRFADERSYSFCFDGVEKRSTVAIGTHGCIKKLTDRAYFEKGLAEMVKRLQPQTIIVYGAAPGYMFGKYKAMGIRIMQFDSAFSAAHKKAVNA
ncbi:DUF4417 domain-containing protein [Hydrogeniiclostridium mannosilyticum]|uniref:DUF4417 domain-containing protein n=1 Tax=Hydrogeniiclostridium mannosilyticum TaxID=2764322 RepID=UPI00399A396A